MKLKLAAAGTLAVDYSLLLFVNMQCHLHGKGLLLVKKVCI